jgi:phosphate transport system substrate-binding protein|tara:strand:- start:163 stop:1098 length:936 start_codon:yes stop_codon:yes gene_type:complete
VLLVTGCAFSPVLAREANQISVVGSSTVFPFATIASEKWSKSTGHKAPIIESTGSGGGLKLFCAGIGIEHPDVTNASRAIKKSEKELCAKNGITPIEYLIGYDGITFSNSNKAPQYKLTKEHIFLAVAKDIPSNGKWVENGYIYWSNIDPNLPKVKINVIAPPPSSGTRDAFVELVMHSVCKKIYKMPKKGEDGYKARCSSLREDGLVVEAGENDNLIVAKLTNDQSRFGIFGFSFLDQNRDRVQGSIIDNVSPSFDTIADGSYGVSRPLFFYVKKEHIGVIPNLQSYADYFMSLATDDGPLADAGLIPKK